MLTKRKSVAAIDKLDNTVQTLFVLCTRNSQMAPNRRHARNVISDDIHSGVWSLHQANSTLQRNVHF